MKDLTIKNFINTHISVSNAKLIFSCDFLTNLRNVPTLVRYNKQN